MKGKTQGLSDCGSFFSGNHVIWTGCRILKLVSNVDRFIYFFVFCLIKKKRMNCSAIFLTKSPYLFYILKGPKIHFKTTLKNLLRFNANFYIQHQKNSRLTCLLCVKGLVLCFYLSWSGSTLLIIKHIIKVGSKS